MLSHVHLLVPTSLRPVQRLKDMGLEQFNFERSSASNP